MRIISSSAMPNSPQHGPRSAMLQLNDAASGPIKDGQQWIMQHFDPSNANLDTGKLVIKYDGAAPGLDDIQDWWDGFNASHPDFLL